MDFEKVITERYSVRKFEEKHLPKEVIEKLLRAAHLAPTGCNFQPQRILVLNTDDAIEKLKKMEKANEITEDDQQNGEKKIQTATDKYCKEIDDATVVKEKEIMEI